MSVPTYLNKTEKITVTFYGWTDITNITAPENPASISVKILNTDTDPDTLLTTASPIYTGDIGKYYFEWTPTVIGNYNVQFFATFSDGSTDPVNNFFTVYESITSPSSGKTLITDQVIQFAGVLDPLYLDPEEIEVLYPDANKIEVVELIQKYSLEVKKVERLDETKVPPDVPSYVGLEYIQAATACSLSKIFDDISAGNDFSFRLGDLQVDNRPAFKQVLNRGNASTWCELAFVLRKEMMANQVGMKAVRESRGGGDPAHVIPRRKLRHFEKETFQFNSIRQDFDPDTDNPRLNNF